MSTRVVTVASIEAAKPSGNLELPKILSEMARGAVDVAIALCDLIEQQVEESRR